MRQRVIRDAIDPDAVEAARVNGLSDEALSIVVGLFDALADPTRARMLHALIRGPTSVRDLAIIAGVSESAVSHQLRFLRDRHLVKPHRSGTIIRYSLDDHHIAALFREAEYHSDHVLQGLPDHPYGGIDDSQP